MAEPFDAALVAAAESAMDSLGYRIGYARGALGVALRELVRYQEGNKDAFDRALVAIRDGLSATAEGAPIQWTEGGEMQFSKADRG